jgi:hypothetical protein
VTSASASLSLSAIALSSTANPYTTSIPEQAPSRVVFAGSRRKRRTLFCARCFSAASSRVPRIIHHQQHFHLLKVFYTAADIFSQRPRNVIRECQEAPEWNPRYRSPGQLFGNWHGPECGDPSLSISRAQSKAVNDLEAKVARRKRISVARPFAFHPAVSLTQRCLSASHRDLPSFIAFVILRVRVRVRVRVRIPPRALPTYHFVTLIFPCPPRTFHLLPLHLRLPSPSHHHYRQLPTALSTLILPHLSRLVSLHHALRCQPLHSRRPLLSRLQLLQRLSIHARPGTPNGHRQIQSS